MTWKALLHFVPSDLRDSVAGDLEEEFRRRAERSRIRARVWLWLQAIRLSVTFRLERAVHGRALPPIADEIRTAPWFESVRADVAFGMRMFWRQPGFAAIVILVLALGIGANTAMFSVVDAVLWRPLPYPDGGRVVAIGEARPREGRVNGPVAPADFYDWRRESRSFAAMAAYSDVAVNLTGSGEPERLRGLSVASGFLMALGVTPARGRDFRIDEETDGRDRVVLLTDSLWRRRFGANPAVVGATVTFNGNPYEVIGILPASFWWTSRPDVLMPLALDDHDRTLRGAHFLGVVARTGPDVSFDRASEEMAVIGRRLSAAYPLENANHTTSVLPLRDALVGPTRSALLFLFGAVGCVLLIACANVATLLLARATARQKEIAIRIAIGGARGRLVQQMLTESLLLALAGGAAGLAIASWSTAVLRASLPQQFAALPGIDHVAVDARVLLAALLASLATGILFGLGPAVVASDQRVAAAIGEASRGATRTGGRRLRSMLVVAELALSLMLLVGAGLLMVSFRRVTDVSPGFRAEELVLVRLTLPYARYPDAPHAIAFYERLFEQLRRLPGVQQVGATSALPFSGIDARLNLEVERRTVESPLPVRAHPRLVSPGYLQVMGIPILRGRAFTDRDTASAPPVAIINQSAARQFWAGRNPIGDRISLGSPTHWMEIVGVAGDIRHEGLDTDAYPEAYIPFHQPFTSLGAGLPRSLSVVVRTSSEMAAAAPMLRAAVAQVDDQQPVGEIRQMDDLIAQSVAPRRLNLLLLAAFAFVAVSLTAAGLYGVMAYVVALRTREIGVRMALGATPGTVLALVLRQAGTIAAAGIVIGLAGSYAIGRSIASLLFGISAFDPSVYASVSLILATVAFFAILIPSRRATRVDPLIALRDS
jgi:putative ABC transport system permease protein